MVTDLTTETRNDLPSIEDIPGGGSKLTWAGGIDNISITLDHISENHNQTTGELTVRVPEGMLLSKVRLNLTSARSRQDIVNQLKKAPGIFADWPTMINQVCSEALERFRQGEPAIEIWPKAEDTLTPEYLLEPLLYKNHPTVIFGDYGSLKSLAALATAYIVQLPYHDNDLGLTTVTESTPVLYLDWEDGTSSFRRRWSALEHGFNQGAMPILYQRMTATLSDTVDKLQRAIQEHNIGLVIVDSLGPAARGNLNDPEPAIRYHAALRQLGVSSLTLAHTAKGEFNTGNRTIFGSVFFTNLARQVYECKSEQETGESEAFISLKHKKANLSRLHLPLGFCFTFSEDAIKVETADLKNTGLSGELPLSWQIKNLLRRGTMTIKEIAEALEANEASIRTITNRLSKKGYLIKVGESWGLKQEV